MMNKTAFQPFVRLLPSSFTLHAARTPLTFAGAALVAGLLLSGCGAKPEPEEAPTVTVQVAGAASQPIQLKVSADAVIYPLDQAAIVPKISSPVKKFYVNKGSPVHAGQLLAELENQDLAGSVAENQGGYEQANAAYQSELQKSQQDLALAKQQLDSAQKLYDSRQGLFKQGAVAAKDVDDARVALTQAQNQYDLAQKAPNLKAAEAQLNAAKGRNTSAQAQLSYSKIVSPIDGVVTDRPINPGEMPASGSPILTVMNLSQVIARAHISQQDAAHLKAGDAATLTAPGEAKPLPGKVTLVSPALDPGSTTVEIWVQAANPGERLKPGASVRVAMVAQTVPKAIVVPVSSILTEDNGTNAVILLDAQNAPKKKTVKLGIRDEGNVQITDGLQGGERVVTVGAFELDKEDEDVLPKTKILVQAPQLPDEDEDE